MNEERVAALTKTFARAVRQHYVDGPPARIAVFEVLNALAATVAFVLVGTGNSPEAHQFWSDALRDTASGYAVLTHLILENLP